MTTVQPLNADMIQFLATYNDMIDNFRRKSNRLSDNYNYIFYVSNTNAILSERILNNITISGITYYYTINTYRDKKYNRFLDSILIYDTNFTAEDIVDFANTHTNIPLSVLERTHYYLWNGSHLNIAPVIKNQLINYHHTEYIVNQTEPRLPVASIRRQWCKFTIPDYMVHRLGTPCINETPPKIFDQVQGRRLSSLDGEALLNTMLNLDGGGIFLKNKISKIYKSVKPKTPKLTVKKEMHLHVFKENLTKYIQKLSHENNIKLVNNTAVICNPFKSNSYGVIILNVNIDIEDELKESSKSISQSSSNKKSKLCKGYFKTIFKVKEIYEMTK